MRVLHVIAAFDPRYGGPTMALAGLARAQAQAGMHVTVVFCYLAGDDAKFADSIAGERLSVKRIGPAAGPLLRSPILADAVRDAVGENDVVHIHGVWEEIQHQAARAAQQQDKPFLVRPCGMLTPWSLNRNPWRKRLFMALRVRGNLNRASAIHFTTDTERRQTEPLGLRPPAIVEATGIDQREFQTLPPKGSFRNRFPQIGNRPLILFLGRVHPGKGLEYLVPAMASVTTVNAILVAVGPNSGGFQVTLEAKVRELGIENRVLFAGALNGADRVAALADADIFCLPSDHENFGLAVVESLAAGTPVIISKDVAVSREIVSAGIGAIVAREPAAIAAELSRWLGDHALRDGAASKCRAFASDNYDLDRIARRWEEHYARLIAQSDGGVKA